MTTINYATATRDELIAYAKLLEIDHAFKVMNRAAWFANYPDVSNSRVIMLDIGNMHANNHTNGQKHVDMNIRAMINGLRLNEIYRHGGDELVMVIRADYDIDSFIDRFMRVLDSCDLYGTIAVSRVYSGSLESIVDTLDMAINMWKTELESMGMKADRNAPYAKLETDILYC